MDSSSRRNGIELFVVRGVVVGETDLT